MERVSAAERAADAKDGKQDSENFSKLTEPLFGQALGKIKHRTAHHAAVRPCLAVLLAKRALGELRRHAKEPGDDHPENRTRPAEADGDGHASDVAQADCRRKRGGERLEMTDLALGVGVVVFATDNIDRVLETAKVDETHPDSEKNGPHDQPTHNQRNLGAVWFPFDFDV